MPCFRCAARQTDPARGASPWRRGVVRGEQVLVCPDCQRADGGTAALDRCAACGSTALGRALGETRCRACGHVGPGTPAAEPAAEPAVGTGSGTPSAEPAAGTGPAAADGPGAGPGAAAGDLAGEVAAALDRVLGPDERPPRPEQR